MMDIKNAFGIAEKNKPCQEINDQAALFQTPMVSVHMITYNHAPYIGQAIEGVLMQKTDYPYELIIGEDCSTDRTREIVFDYQRKYPHIIRVITSDKNVGAHENSYRVGQACRGKYIAFCEGDDYWIDPYKLQKQVDFLEGHREYGLVYGNCNILYEKSNRYKRHKKRWANRPSGFVFEWLLMSGSIPTLTVMLTVNLLYDFMKSDNRNHLLKNSIGDYTIWLHLSTRTMFKHIDEVFAVYRRREESAFHSKDMRKTINIWKDSYNIRFYYMDKYQCTKKTKDIVNSNYHRLMLHLYYEAADYRSAREHFTYIKKKRIDDYLLLIGATNPFTISIIDILVLVIQNIRKVKGYVKSEEHHTKT